MVNLLTNECVFCGETWIKDKIGQAHGCAAEAAALGAPKPQAAKEEDEGDGGIRFGR